MNRRRSLKQIRNLDATTIGDDAGHYDLIIAANCPESRCLRIPDIVKKASSKKIAFSTHDASDAPDDSIRRRLIANGFSICDYSEDQLNAEIDQAIQVKTSNNGNANTSIGIFVDITNIPRRIFASIVGTLLARSDLQAIDLGIGYTLARYTPPPSSALAPNKRVAPVHPLLAGWISQPGLPVTTVVGLGYERGKALGAVEYLQAADRFLFVPESPETKYKPKVQQHNRNLIEASKADRVIEYEVMKPVQTLLTLGAVIAGLKNEAKPVLFPFGPKIFFAVSVLAAIVHQEAAVWYVSGEEAEPSMDRSASAYSTGLRCVIQCDVTEPL